MSKININLLPPELESVKKLKKQRLLLLNISLGFVAVCIMIAAGVLTYMISLKVELGRLDKEYTTLDQTLKSKEYQTKEWIAFDLKTRLDGINNSYKKDFPSSYAFSLVRTLIPEKVNLQSVNIDKKGRMVLSIETDSTEAMGKLLNNLIDTTVNNSKIKQANIESISKKNDGLYKVEVSALMDSSTQVKKVN